jgi:hypothetical protein
MVFYLLINLLMSRHLIMTWLDNEFLAALGEPAGSNHVTQQDKIALWNDQYACD